MKKAFIVLLLGILISTLGIYVAFQSTQNLQLRRHYAVHKTQLYWHLISNTGDQQHNITPKNPRKSENEARHIAFLKVHKAASSTVQNIFLRFGASRNLSFVIPRVTRFYYPNIISLNESVTADNIYPPPENKSYDILCCHVIYNRQAFKAIMPPDTFYIGILREPFEQFISTLNYIRPSEIFNISEEHPINRFLRNPTDYVSKTSRNFVNNRMALEYNFPKAIFQRRNKDDIAKYLKKLDTEFDLILIVERFDESLLLMRRILNWDMKDVLYIEKNARTDLYERIKFRGMDVERYKRWADLDYALYDYFFKRLMRRVANEGEDFHNELLYFKTLKQTVKYFCSESENSKTMTVSKSLWSKSFNVSRTDCDAMFAGEINFIVDIRRKQYKGMHFNDSFN